MALCAYQRITAFPCDSTEVNITLMHIVTQFKMCEKSIANFLNLGRYWKYSMSAFLLCVTLCRLLTFIRNTSLGVGCITQPPPEKQNQRSMLLQKMIYCLTQRIPEAEKSHSECLQDGEQIFPAWIRWKPQKGTRAKGSPSLSETRGLGCP